MRILHLTSGNLYGGIEALLVTLARHRELCPALEQHFGVCFFGRLEGELRAMGVPVHHFGEVRVRSPWSIWQARSRLRKLLAEESFDAVICHAPWPLGVFAPAVKNSRLVFWQHDVAGGTHWVERWARTKHPKLAISNSQITGDSLPKLFPGLPAHVLYNPVGSADFAADERMQARAEFGVGAEKKIILLAARMEAWKGQAVLVEAAAKMKAAAGDWQIWIAGGPQRPQEEPFFSHLKELIAHFELADEVKLLGQRKDVRRLMFASDIYCQPNVSPEPFGIVFAEAMLAGLPVVASSVGGPAELVGEQAGILVPPGDADAVARALQSLLVSGESRLKLGSAGRGRAQQLCDPGTQLNRLQAILKAS